MLLMLSVARKINRDSLRRLGGLDRLVVLNFLFTRLGIAENSSSLLSRSKSIDRILNCTWSQVQLRSTSVPF